MALVRQRRWGLAGRLSGFRTLALSVPAALLLGHGAGAEPWKFLVAGDSIGFSAYSLINTQILAELGNAITNEKPAFVLFAGDYAVNATPETYAEWSNILAAVYQAGIPIYPALGNHDLGDRQAFVDAFGALIPDNGPAGEVNFTYAFAWSNALVLVLDVYTPTNSFRVNQEWVDAVLATNRLPHVFALAHAPAFHQAHPDCLDNYPAQRDRFWNSLSNANCRIYFTGHDHFYDRARIDDGDGYPENDLYQIVVGTAGAPIYGEAPYDGTNSLWTPIRAYHEANFGYVRVEIDGDIGRTTWVRRAAPGIYEPSADVFTWSAIRRPMLSLRQLETGTWLDWSGAAMLQVARSPGGAYTDLPGAKPPFFIESFPGQTLFFRLKQ